MATKILPFVDRLPDDIQSALREQAGEWMFGTQVKPEWPANWHEVFLHKAVERALTETAKRLMEKAAEKLLKIRQVKRYDVHRAINNAVEKHLQDLIDAARLPPRVRNWEAEIAKQEADMSAKVATLNKEAKSEVRQLERKLAVARKLMQELTAKYDYPAVPEPMAAPTKYGDGLPDTSGVYFVWQLERVAYVGQSIRLNGRATLSHEKIEEEDMLSWLEFPVKTLDFAEAFYIGVTKPSRNFKSREKLGLKAELRAKLDLKVVTDGKAT